MDEAGFWEVIDQSKRNGEKGYEQAQRLEEILQESPPEEIEKFFLIFEEKHVKLYHWDFWGVAYLLNGGCSDDSFIDFRSWLIGQGKEAYEKALLEPDGISSLVSKDDCDVCCEELKYASINAYEKVTGNDIYDVLGAALPSGPASPEGEEWEEDDDILAARFPKSHAKSLALFSAQSNVLQSDAPRKSSVVSGLKKWFKKK